MSRPVRTGCNGVTPRPPARHKTPNQHSARVQLVGPKGLARTRITAWLHLLRDNHRCEEDWLPIDCDEVQACDRAQPLDVQQGDDKALGRELGDGVDGLDRLKNGVLTRIRGGQLRKQWLPLHVESFRHSVQDTRIGLQFALSLLDAVVDNDRDTEDDLVDARP